MKSDFDKLIQRHQEMWNWIADEIEKDKIVYPDDYNFEYEYEDFADYKSKYLAYKGYRDIHYNCFLCDFIIRKYHLYDGKRCNYCPVEWPSDRSQFPCEDVHTEGDGKGLYRQFWNCTNYKDAAKLARQIANLPITPLKMTIWEEN